MDLRAAVAERREELIRLRREVHAHPELAFQERRTAQLVADHLTKAGLKVTQGLVETAIVGLLEGGRPGKTLLVRADMDALPLHEQSDVPYRSQNEGVAHACGHDGHVAVALTVASILADHRRELPGQVKFVFQPAEEVAGGAERLIAAGVLQNPSVDAALALHMWNDLPVGKVGVRPGPTFASADEIEIVIKGKGGHGAQPHQAVDAIAIAGQVITA
ncbi:MAG: amidohydrolase, partial [Chloroflexi bacterium]|nr:amidohydrolase [Chloroflexota bacterium]